MAPEIVTGRENIGNSGDHTSERPQAPPPPKVERRDNGLHHGPEHMREVVAEHKAQRERKAEREIAALKGRLEQISENRPSAPLPPKRTYEKPTIPSQRARQGKNESSFPTNRDIKVDPPTEPATEPQPANNDTVTSPTQLATRPSETGFLGKLKRGTRKVAGIVGFVSLLGGDKPASGETPHPTTDTRPSTATPKAENISDTKVNADFSVGETTLDTNPAEITAVDKLGGLEEEQDEIRGEYTIKKAGESFYGGAKKALYKAFENGADKKVVLAQIVAELDLGDMTDEDKIVQKWSQHVGELNGNVMKKGGGFDFNTTVLPPGTKNPGTTFRVYPQRQESRKMPTLVVVGAAPHETRTHEPSSPSSAETKTAATSFDVHDGGQKRTFAPGDTVTYTTAKGEAADYIVEGPSEDGGLILKRKDSKGTFAISDKGLGRVAEQKKLTKDEEPKDRIFTPPVNPSLPDTPEHFLNPSLNATPEAPAEPPAPKDESGLKDMGRLDPINSDFSTNVPESEIRVRKSPDSVEEALLGNGTVPDPEKDPARARAMIAWHELDLVLSQSFLGYPEEYKKATEEALKFTQELLAKGEIQQAENTYNRLAAKLQARAEAKKVAEGQLSIFFRKIFRGRPQKSNAGVWKTITEFFSYGREVPPTEEVGKHLADSDQ